MGFGSGGYGAMAYGDGAAADQIVGVMLPDVVHDDGGTLVTVQAVVPAGTYRPHLGPTLSVDDPVAFTGPPGAGGLLVITPTTTNFQLWTPPLPVGTGYGLFLAGVGNADQTVEDLMTVIKHDYRSRVLAFRRDHFPPQWRLGYREAAQDRFFFNLDTSAPPAVADPGTIP